MSLTLYKLKNMLQHNNTPAPIFHEFNQLCRSFNCKNVSLKAGNLSDNLQKFLFGVGLAPGMIPLNSKQKPPPPTSSKDLAVKIDRERLSAGAGPPPKRKRGPEPSHAPKKRSKLETLEEKLNMWN